MAVVHRGANEADHRDDGERECDGDVGAVRRAQFAQGSAQAKADLKKRVKDARGKVLVLEALTAVPAMRRFVGGAGVPAYRLPWC